MLFYPGHFRDDYCIAKVVDTHMDEDKKVRKVTITYRKKNPREPRNICKSKSMIIEKVCVHRLHRLHLVDEDLVPHASHDIVKSD